METLDLATLSINVQANGVAQANTSINNLTSNMNNSGNATNNFSDAFKNLGGKLKESISNTKIFGTSIGDLKNSFSGASGGLNMMNVATMALKASMILLAAEGIKKVVEAIGEMTDAGDRIDKMSQKLSMSASQFQMWESIASHNGTSIETLGKAIKEITISAESNTEAYKKMGIEVINVDGTLKGSEEIFKNTILALSDMEKGTERDAKAQELLGGRYQELLPLINGGRESILQQIEASKKAVTMTDEHVKAAARLTDANQALGEQVTALKNGLIGGMLEPFAKIKETLSETLNKLRPFTDLIGSLIGGMLSTLASLIIPVVEALGSLLDILKPVFDEINNIFNLVVDGLKTSISVFSALMGTAQKEAGDTAKATTDKIKEETDNALGFVETAIDKWVNARVEEKRKSLEKFNGTSLQGMIRTEQQIQAYQEQMKKAGDSSVRYYQLQEEAKTDITKRNLLTRTKNYEQYFSKTSGSSGGTSKSYFTGTSYHTGGFAMMGEIGRELVELPRGAKVYNNRQTENILNNSNSSTNQNIYITVDASNIRELNDITNLFNDYTRNSRM